MLPLQAADYLAWQVRRRFAVHADPATVPPDLAVLPPSRFLVGEGDLRIRLDVLDASFLQEFNEATLTARLAELEHEDLPADTKDYFRRFITAKLRGEPLPAPPLGVRGVSE